MGIRGGFMTLIYKPDPKSGAGEYAKYAVNLFTGCRYNCSYCYNKLMFKRFHPKEDFSKPTIKPNVLEQLKKEAPKYAGKEIFMSFSTDPFQNTKEFNLITLKLIDFQS